MQRPWDGESEEGADLALLLEGIRSALEEQTWFLRQMWSTHTAVESEPWLLHRGMDFIHDQLYWVGEVEREVEREGAREGGVLEEGREEETME